MKNKDQLIRIIKKHIAAPYQSAVLEAIKPSIRLQPTGKLPIAVGQTKLGGVPDLPALLTWARSAYDEQFLSFLGQVLKRR